MFELDPSEASARRAVAGERRASAPTCASSSPSDGPGRGDDLISGLVAVADEGDQLTERELVATCVLLLNAGHEASVNGAGNGWWTLFRHPDALAACAPTPDLAADRRRRAPSLRHAALAVRTVGPRARSRSTVSSIPRGWRGRPAVRVGEPRPGSVRRPGHARPRPRPEPAPVVRGRDPLLPRRAAGQAGAGDAFETLLRRMPAAGARRGAALEADVRPARPRGATRAGLTVR